MVRDATVGTPAEDDETLVRAVVSGSDRALAHLYDRHAGAVFKVALAVGVDRSLAEEVVQETFLALWDRAELFDPDRGTLTVWLASIARHRAIDRFRAAGRRIPAAPFSSLVDETPDAPATLDRLIGTSRPLAGGAAELGPDEVITRRESQALIVAAVHELPDAERQVILLAYRDGLSQSEIAERLGWPLGTVKTRSRRALGRLRAALAEADRQSGSAVGPGPRPTRTQDARSSRTVGRGAAGHVAANAMRVAPCRAC